MDLLEFLLETQANVKSQMAEGGLYPEEIFSNIMRQKGRVGHILHAMHRVDFLGRWMPEFGRLTALVQHEYFHRYTVDEHTLVCIEKLDSLLDTENPRHQGHRELFQKLEDPYVLYLALLLHDTGKAANSKNHAVESTTNADKVSRRLQLKSEERRMLIRLVDNHDLMARTARQRDITDPATIEEFALIVLSTAWCRLFAALPVSCSSSAR